MQKVHLPVGALAPFEKFQNFKITNVLVYKLERFIEFASVFSFHWEMGRIHALILYKLNVFYNFVFTNVPNKSIDHIVDSLENKRINLFTGNLKILMIFIRKQYVVKETLHNHILRCNLSL